MNTLKRLGALAVLLAGFSIAQANQEQAGAKKEAMDAKHAAVIAEQLPSYPTNTCLVSGEALGGMEDCVAACRKCADSCDRMAA